MRLWWSLPMALAACQPAPAGEEISCGPAGGALNQRCSVERAGSTLTLRQPEGAFHRLAIVTDGRGLVSADGAEEVAVAPAGADRIDATIGGWTYRLPATVTP